MKGDGHIPAAPNLEALSSQRPRRKLTIVRLLWPKIRVCLDRGHTVREIRERLKLDGVEVNYKNLCACIAELRQREDKAGSPASEPRPHNRAAQADPLANVRRLTEDRRPGFSYPGTLPEKDLFGE